MKKCIIIAVVLFSSFGLKASAQVVCPDAYVCVPVCPVGYTCTPIIPTGEATSTFVSQLQNQIGQLQALVDGLNQVYSTPVVVQPVQSSPVVGSVPQPTQTVGNVPDNSPSFSVGSEICRGDVRIWQSWFCTHFNQWNIHKWKNLFHGSKQPFRLYIHLPEYP